MGALFILIILGVVWIIRSIYTGVGDFKTSVYRGNYFHIKLTVCNSTIADELCPHLSNCHDLDGTPVIGTEEEYWDMIKDIHDDLREVFGENWKEIYKNAGLYHGYNIGDFRDFDCYNGSCSEGFRNVWNLAYEIVLAKKGLIPYNRDNYRIRNPITGINRGEQFDVAKKACRIIEKYMQQAHPDLNLALVPSNGKIYGYSLSWNFYFDYLGIKY